MPAETGLKILIADESLADVELLEAEARKLGHRVLTARGGREAVEMCRRERPDLVFMDVTLPRMDALSVVREIRTVAGERWVPVVFYSAPDRMEDIINGLEAGGDDYLAKPASPRVLRAKINSYARLLSLQDRTLAYKEELAQWRSQAEEETRLSSHVMARLTETAGLRDPLVRHFNMPTETFGGDLVCAARAPGDILYVMLADATGHGLPAALTALPLTQVFYGMTAKGFPLGTIAEELNRKLQALMPADRFVAATLAAMDVHNQTVEVWNGGNPDAMFFNTAGEVALRWPSQHPPLGILPDAAFSGVTQTLSYRNAGRLLLCSDGLVDAESPTGERWGQDEIARLLSQTAPDRQFSALVQELERHLSGRAAHDDISFLMVDAPVERRQTVRAVPQGLADQGGVSEWRLEVSYGAQALRELDVVPVVLGFITQLNALKPHQGTLFLVVSELFNNALDHGLLCLDSTMKRLDGGFDRYLQQRSERLATLNQGHIGLAFKVHESGGRAMLDISLTDSGKGFDYRPFLGDGSSENPDTRPHGRGIVLVRSLCQEIVYHGAGNRVSVRYLL